MGYSGDEELATIEDADVSGDWSMEAARDEADHGSSHGEGGVKALDLDGAVDEHTDEGVVVSSPRSNPTRDEALACVNESADATIPPSPVESEDERRTHQMTTRRKRIRIPKRCSCGEAVSEEEKKDTDESAKCTRGGCESVWVSH
jgi:hypothetical protein